MTGPQEKSQVARRLFDGAQAELGGLPLTNDTLTVTTTIDQSAVVVATPKLVAVIAPAATINANSIGTPKLVPALVVGATIDQHAVVVPTPKLVPVIAPAATLDYHAATAAPTVLAVIAPSTIDQHAVVVPTPKLVPVLAPAATLDYHATTVPTPSLVAVIAPPTINSYSIGTPLVVAVFTPPSINRAASTSAPSLVPIIAPSAPIVQAPTTSPPSLVVPLVIPATLGPYNSIGTPKLVPVIAPPATLSYGAIGTPSLVPLIQPPDTLSNYSIGTPDLVAVIAPPTINQAATTTPPSIFHVIDTGMVVICATVAVQGGNDPPTYTFGASNSMDMGKDVVERPLISIRPKLVYNNITNRALLLPTKMFIACDGGTTTWRLVVNPDSLDGADFVSNSPRSHAEVDKKAMVLTGGEELLAGFLSPARPTEQVDLAGIFSRLGRVLRIDAFGTIQDTLSIVMQNTNPDAAAVCRGSISWGELK